MALTQVDGGLLSPTNGQFYGMKSRIINGAMMIDQRNAGASVALSGTPKFVTDRFNVRVGSGSGHTAIQSSTAPAGFAKSLLITVGTGTTPTAGNGTNYFQQVIEGFNVSDLGWGTANAQPVTLSFKVRSSLTGTFGGSFQNYSGNRSYPFTFTISAANTFEDKTVTIAGDTVGSWETNNSGGIVLLFDLGCGSDYLGTAGAWAGADYRGATGDTKLIATSGATFYITGVQLEKGSTATSFDYRPYGTELALCQRYYWKVGASSNSSNVTIGSSAATTICQWALKTPVTMRAYPTLGFSGVVVDDGGTLSTVSSISAQGAVSPADVISAVVTGSATLTVGRAGIVRLSTASTSYMDFSSEL